MPLAPPIFLESPPNFRLITRNPFSLHCVWGQHWIFCANNVQSLINNLINTWNIRFSKKMCYFNTKSNEFSWFTHICCKTLSSWFTHFFRQIFGAEILAPPKVLLLECMFYLFLEICWISSWKLSLLPESHFCKSDAAPLSFVSMDFHLCCHLVLHRIWNRQKHFKNLIK